MPDARRPLRARQQHCWRAGVLTSSTTPEGGAQWRGCCDAQGPQVLTSGKESESRSPAGHARAGAKIAGASWSARPPSRRAWCGWHAARAPFRMELRKGRLRTRAEKRAVVMMVVTPWVLPDRIWAGVLWRRCARDRICAPFLGGWTHRTRLTRSMNTRRTDGRGTGTASEKGFTLHTEDRESR